MALTLAQIRTLADNALANLWPQVQTFEANWFNTHGVYFQCLVTHNLPPADGNTVVPDNLDAKPFYQALSLRDLFPNLATTALPMRFSIDQYVTPDGTAGYVALVQVLVTVAGVPTLFERAAQVGPETWRAFGWRQAAAGGA